MSSGERVISHAVLHRSEPFAPGFLGPISHWDLLRDYRGFVAFTGQYEKDHSLSAQVKCKAVAEAESTCSSAI